MTNKEHSGLRYALILVLLVSCQKSPELASEFPNHTFLKIGELGTDVRLSFSGPELEASQLLGEEASADESLFVLLEPRALRSARTVDNLDGGFDDSVVAFCSKACAPGFKFREQGIWMKGEVCREGPVAVFSTLNVPTGNAKQGRVYETSELSFPGQLELPDQVVCYEAYFFYEGEVTCQQSCQKCGPGDIDCVFYSPSLGFLPTDVPEGRASLVFEIDCDFSDLTQCGGALPVGN